MLFARIFADDYYRVWFYGLRIRKFIYIRQKIVYRNDVNISQFISRITDTDLFLI